MERVKLEHEDMIVIDGFGWKRVTTPPVKKNIEKTKLTRKQFIQALLDKKDLTYHILSPVQSDILKLLNKFELAVIGYEKRTLCKGSYQAYDIIYTLCEENRELKDKLFDIKMLIEG